MCVKNIKFIDLFAGIGGIRMGLEMASKEWDYNYKCVFSSEFDKDACITYQANLGEFPAVDEIPDVLKERRYDKIKDPFWVVK